MSDDVVDVTALYRRYAPELYRFAHALSGDRAEAEDVVSETFVRAWASAESIVTSTVRGYLFTIARRVYLQRLRTRRRHTALAPELPAAGADPHAASEARAELARVGAHLLRLKESDRAALLLHAVHGLSHAEVAAALGITPSAAKVKVHRARLALAAWRTAE